MLECMKVLVVEDDKIIQRMYSQVVQQAGHELLTAADGAEAQNAAESGHPDIIMMDVMMPHMNGIDALKTLKESEQTREIPVIMLSAYDDPELMQQALDAGAERYVTKSSMEPAQVIELLQRTYAESKQRQFNPDTKL